MSQIPRQIFIGIILLGLTGCSENKSYETSICALIDISGTYAEEKSNVVDIIKAGILPVMIPGDSLFFLTIDSNSYHEENLKHKVTFDYRPSYANKQKLDFANKLDEFAASNVQSGFTDISGAMMLCSDYLKSTGTGTQVMFIFSDMVEDLKQGLKREFESSEFDNIHIAAMNVIKLGRDSSNPQVYRNRLSNWEKKVTHAGAAEWGVIIEPANIVSFIENSK